MTATHAVVDQERLDSMLARGILFSIVWILGFGSLYAFLTGLRARRLILTSGGTLVGMKRAWWCLTVGGIGMLIWFPIIIVGVVNNLR